MKTISKLFLIVIACTFIFSSCSIEKRHYLSGYFINWRSHKNKTAQNNDKNQGTTIDNASNYTPKIETEQNIIKEENTTTTTTTSIDNKQISLPKTPQVSSVSKHKLNISEGFAEIKSDYKRTLTGLFSHARSTSNFNQYLHKHYTPFHEFLHGLICMVIFGVPALILISIYPNPGAGLLLLIIFLALLFLVYGVVYFFAGIIDMIEEI
jgi:lipopolysaccharide export LptBFGC system permease protein LptF